jgi:hypothetical protein
MAQSVKIMVREVRCTYPKLFTPEEYKGKTKYSIGLIIPKDSDNFKRITEAIQQAVANQFGEKDVAKKLKSFKIAGVTKMPVKPFGDDDDTVIITPKLDAAKGKPTVLNRNKTPINPEAGIPFGGCWVNCSLDVFCHNKEGGGIAFYLNGVQFVKEDAHLDAGASHANCADDFDALEDTGDESETTAKNEAEDIW